MEIKVNAMQTPFLDSNPRFSWFYEEDESFTNQAGYTLTIADDDAFQHILYSKKEKTDERANIYTDMVWEPLKKYYVKVESTFENGTFQKATTHFRTGFRGTKWNGRYITGGKPARVDDILHAIYLRKEFSAEDIEHAELYIVGLGYFEAHINGKKVGTDFLSTPYTAYDKHIEYRAFDVTELLQEGENAIGVILGNGFYNCFTDDPWQFRTAPWRDVPKMMAELHITGKNGEKIVASDNSWESVVGPIVFNGIRHGESYDANLEKDGWDMPGYTGEKLRTRYVKNPGALLTLMEMEPIRVRATYKPVLCRKVKNGYLYELSQNIAGIANITFSGKAGTKYQMRYCDRLYDDGELDQETVSCFVHNYCFQTDTYIKRTDEPETWHPLFTYHGFQYIEISGSDEPLPLENIEAWALCNDFADRGTFTCSDETVNQIQHLCNASTTSCCMNTFSADAVREKNSWTGDTGLSTEQLLINYGAENLMRKWAQDFRDSERPGGCLPCIVPSAGWGYNSLNGPDWSHPMVDVPWNLYMEYGDIEVLKQNYEALKAHVSYIESMADGYIANYGLGDWCPPFDGPAISVNMSSYKCPLAVSDTAFYYSAVKMAETLAGLLGHPNDALSYKILRKNIRDAFHKELYDAKTYTVKGDCQTATAMMIYHGIATKEEVPFLIAKLLTQIERENGHLDFGILGCKAVMESLGRNDQADAALHMLTNPTYPSMKHWLDMGTTTLFECWNGGGNRNQHMFSSVSAFFYKYIAGIAAEAPGYRKIGFRPYVNGYLDTASATIDTPYGKTSCSFKKLDGKTYIDITVPISCEGTLYLDNKTYRLPAGKHVICKES